MPTHGMKVNLGDALYMTPNTNFFYVLGNEIFARFAGTIPGGISIDFIYPCNL